MDGRHSDKSHHENDCLLLLSVLFNFIVRPIYEIVNGHHQTKSHFKTHGLMTTCTSLKSMVSRICQFPKIPNVCDLLTVHLDSLGSTFETIESEFISPQTKKGTQQHAQQRAGDHHYFSALFLSATLQKMWSIFANAAIDHSSP